VSEESSSERETPSLPAKRTAKEAPKVFEEIQVEQPPAKKPKLGVETAALEKEEEKIAIHDDEEVKEDVSESSSSYDSEEERRREQEQLKKEVVEHLRKKQEPLTMQQLSYQLKSGKKVIEQALEQLQRT